MGDVMTSILTDAAQRDEAAVEQLLKDQAEIAGPWYNAAEQ